MSTRNACVGFVALLAVQTAGALIIHQVEPVGRGPVADPNATILTGWDIGIDVRDPDFWLESHLQATMDAAWLTQYQFAPFNENLEPPRNPASDAEAFSNFFTTARHFPNNTETNEPVAYDFELGSATRGLIDVTWSSALMADGLGPFTLFRLAITQDADAPQLTTQPLGPLVVSISGFSRTQLEGETAFTLSLYQVPEPGMLGLVLLGAVFVRRR